jgi:Calponin homology (CH) domain
MFAELVNIKLLQWVGEHLSDQSIIPIPTDLGPSWRDGVALCYLINSVCPGSCPDATTLKPYHRVKNCRLALRLANQYLQLPLVS